MSDLDTEIAENVGVEAESDSSLDSLLTLSSDSFTKTRILIQVKDIGLSEPLKVGRSQTIIGLSQSIAELGVLTPIHVMTVEQHDDDDDDDSYKYMLLEGLRRVYGAVKNGIKEIEAVVWDFKDKDLGRNIALSLGLLLDRKQKRHWKEVWELYQILELQSDITPGTLEYLLQLEAGDAMKLKDCMLCDYEEVKEMVLGGEKTLEQAYKQLQKLRKEENKLAKEEETGLSGSVEGAEEIVFKEVTPQLSDDEVSDLLEIGNSFSDSEIESGEVGLEDLDKSAEVRGIDHQQVGARHPIDPVIKKSTLDRDKFTCQCCSTHGAIFLGSLVYHHKIPVHCGGADTVENGLTLCASCHITLHLYEQGRLAMSAEQFGEYTEEEQIRIKKIMRYGNIAIESAKRKGLSKKQIEDGAKSGTRHLMPGEGLKDNVQAFNSSKNKEE